MGTLLSFLSMRKEVGRKCPQDERRLRVFPEVN